MWFRAAAMIPGNPRSRWPAGPDSRSGIPCAAWITLSALLAWPSLGPCLAAAERAEFAATAANVDRLQGKIGALLELADHPELADVLAHRLQAAQDLPGLDRTRPLALRRFPPTEQPESDLVVLPTTDPRQLVQTFTAGLVDFTQTSENLFTIDRPGSPYYALSAKGYLWMGDSLTRLRSESQSGVPQPALPDDPDLRLVWRRHAVPETERALEIQAWKQGIEPWLQQRDDESDADYRPRRLWGHALLWSGETLWRHVTEISVSIRLEAKQQRGMVEVDVQLSPDHPAAEWLSRWQGTPHPLRQWCTTTDARASGFAQFPAGSLAQVGDSRPVTVGAQVFGDFLPIRTAVLMLDHAAAETQPAPATGDSPRKPEITTIPLPALPDWTRTWIGGHTEAYQSIDGDRMWWGFGPPPLARERFAAVQEALVSEAETPPVQRLPVVELRIPLKEVWDWFPFIDPVWAQQLIQDRDDRVRLALFSSRDRLQCQITVPEGGLCVVAGWFVDELHGDLQQFLSTP